MPSWSRKRSNSSSPNYPQSPPAGSQQGQPVEGQEPPRSRHRRRRNGRMEPGQGSRPPTPTTSRRSRHRPCNRTRNAPLPFIDTAVEPQSDAAQNTALRPAGPEQLSGDWPVGFIPPIGIDKSVLRHSEPKRHRNKEHLRFVARQPCVICARTPSDPHHLRFAQRRALGRKVSDEFVVPLCRTHHRALHRVGNEPGWWKTTGIDPLVVARQLWGQSRLSAQPEPVPLQAPSEPLRAAAADPPSGSHSPSLAPRPDGRRINKKSARTAANGRMP